MGIGLNLKRILANKKLTIKDLSVQSGVPLNTLYSITKRDPDSISSSVLTAIAMALEVSPFDITVDVTNLSDDTKLVDQISVVFGSGAVELLCDYDTLNDQGKQKALDYLNDLSMLEVYKKTGRK